MQNVKKTYFETKRIKIFHELWQLKFHTRQPNFLIMSAKEEKNKCFKQGNVSRRKQNI